MEAIWPAQVIQRLWLSSLELTASLHLKMDGWSPSTFSFPFRMGLLSGAFAVSFREGKRM